jgi:hypothetical protein
MHKKGVVLTLDAIFALIVAVLMILWTLQYLANITTPAYNKQALSRLGQDALTVMEKENILRDAMETGSISHIIHFFNSTPEQICHNLTIKYLGQTTMLAVTKIGCDTNTEPVIARRAFISYDRQIYFAELQSWYTYEPNINYYDDLILWLKMDFNYSSWFLPDHSVSDLLSVINGQAVCGAPVSAVSSGGCLFQQGYLNLSNTTVLNMQSYVTLSLWINTTNVTGQHYILDKAEGAPANDGYNLVMNGNVLTFTIFTNGTNATTNFPNYNCVNCLNHWQHIAAVYNGTNAIIYVNGTRVNMTAKNGVIPSTFQDLIIGRINDPLGTVFYQGEMDDLRVYSRALSADEVLALYNSYPHQ